MDLNHKITSNYNQLKQKIWLSKPSPVCARCATSDSVLIRYSLGYKSERDLFPIGNLKIQLIPFERSDFSYTSEGYEYSNKTPGMPITFIEPAKLNQQELAEYQLTLDEKGEAVVKWGEDKYQKYERYSVVVLPVAKEDVQAWMQGYQTIIDALSEQLAQQWRQELLPEWQRLVALETPEQQYDCLETAYREGQIGEVKKLKEKWDKFEVVS